MTPDDIACRKTSLTNDKTILIQFTRLEYRHKTWQVRKWNMKLIF